MSADLIDELRQAYPRQDLAPRAFDEVWQRGRRARRRRQLAQVTAVVGGLAILVGGVAQVAGTQRVDVVDEPAGSVQRVGGWDVLPTGTFTYDIEARLGGWETVLDVGADSGVVFDVDDDGTLAAFLPASGTIVVLEPGGERRSIDAGFLLEPFPADASSHQLRIGPDRRYYLASANPDAGRDQHRLTVFDRRGELAGTKVVAPHHGPPVFADGWVLVQADGGWLRVAPLDGSLHGQGGIAEPRVPEVTWIDDQGSIVNQVLGGPHPGERYTLNQDGRRLDWTGPVEGVMGWGHGELREDRVPVVLVQHDEHPTLVLVPSLDGLLAAWAPPEATGLSGVGPNRAITVTSRAGEALYWVEEANGITAIVRSTP